MLSIAPASATPTSEVPVGEIIRHTDVYGGSGWLTLEADGRYWLEHCRGGCWGSCDLGEHADLRSARMAAMRHLRRKRHGYDRPQQLAGIAHAGGGQLVKGQLVKGPVE